MNEALEVNNTSDTYNEEIVSVPSKKPSSSWFARPKLVSWKSMIKVVAKKRNVKRSPFKSFIMLIYLLYYRYTSETGITTMTYTEATLTNLVFAFLLFAFFNQGSRLIFNGIAWIVQFTRCAMWTYNPMNQISVDQL